MLFEVLAVLGGAALAAAAVSLRVVKQYERGLVLRTGRVLDQVRGPGLAMIVPVADRLHKVNKIVTMAVPAQEGITHEQCDRQGGRGRLLSSDRSGTSGRQCPGLSLRCPRWPRPHCVR